MRASVAWLTAVALATTSAVTQAKPGRLDDTPCKGCILALPPEPTTPLPLLVLLHGDGAQAPSTLVTAWERFTRPKGIALLALSCPRDLRCEGSWWRWDGDPAWLDAQVRAVAATHPVDPTRVWLAGWSGGASYLGRRLEDLPSTFAGVVFHGGGIPPRTSTCTAAPLPTFFLVGDGNPLHHLATALRDEAKSCHHDVTWSLVASADHAAEWRALDTRGPEVVAWLLAHPRAAAVAPVEVPDAAPVTASPATASSPPPPAPAPRATAAPPSSRAGCTFSPEPAPPGGWVALLAAVLAVRRRRPLTTS